MRSKARCNCDIESFISWALKRAVQCAEHLSPELQKTIRTCRPAQPWRAKHKKNTQPSATLRCTTQCNCDIQRFISWASVQCAEQLFKICVWLQFRASDTPSPARGFIHQTQMPVALQRRAFPNVRMRVSLQRRAQKCMNRSTTARSAARNEKSKVLLYSFGWSTPRFWREGCATANEIRVSLQFWATDRQHVFDEMVARRQTKLAFRYSSERSTPRF